ncbi:MAG TPA: hypothetical protein VKD90_10725 [Gemmataceae bacterium]|nr:hypothetical protein [Gemmataceae bacterium]
MLMVGLAAARLLAGPGPGPAGPWFAVAVGAAGAGLALWGFARLRRARAVRADWSWWGLLRTELVALGIATVWLTVWVALPAEQRDALVRSMREAFELVHVARGHP